MRTCSATRTMRPFDVTHLNQHSGVVVRMWTQQMPQHWKGYAEYRVRVFTKLLFQSNQVFWNGTHVNAAPDCTLWCRRSR